MRLWFHLCEQEPSDSLKGRESFLSSNPRSVRFFFLKSRLLQGLLKAFIVHRTSRSNRWTTDTHSRQTLSSRFKIDTTCQDLTTATRDFSLKLTSLLLSSSDDLVFVCNYSCAGNNNGKSMCVFSINESTGKAPKKGRRTAHAGLASSFLHHLFFSLHPQRYRAECHNEEQER
jgi:hypothetical protein